MHNDEAGEQPSAALRDEAFDALVAAVQSLAELGRSPTASEARLEVGRRTYGGFNLRALGYKRFRDFLKDAEDAGRVIVDPTRPGDITVSVPGVRSQVEASVPGVRNDLWKAFVDWAPGKSRLYDLIESRAIILPTEPAPLEPEKFKKARELSMQEPERFIVIEPITVKQQIGWMREFAETVGDSRLRSLLEAALESEKPVKVFLAVLREAPAELVRWRSQFTHHVREVIQSWRASDPRLAAVVVDRASAEMQNPPEASADSTQQVTNRTTDEFQHLLTLLASTRVGSFARTTHVRPADGNDGLGAQRLRLALHLAIDRMPIEELRSLRIPVGYLFEE